MAMRAPKQTLFNIFFLFLVITSLSSCASTNSRSVGQAAIKNFETRTIDASFDDVFGASTEALFDLGYTIKHSDKKSGIIVGEKQDARKDEKAVMAILYGLPAASIVTPIVYNLTILIKPDEESVKVRIKTAVDGEPKLNKQVIDRVWIYIDREVLMESPPDTKEALSKDFFKDNVKERNSMPEPEISAVTPPPSQHKNKRSTALVVGKKNLPKNALILKKKTPPSTANVPVKKEKVITERNLDERWKLVGTTRDKSQIFKDSKTISYPAENIIRFWLKVLNNNKEELSLIEVNCVESKIRMIDNRFNKNTSIQGDLGDWIFISPESVSEVIFNNVCPINKSTGASN